MLTDPALLVSRLVFIGFAVEAIEVIIGRRAFVDGALFGRSTTRLLTAGAPWPESALGGVGGPTTVNVVMTAQLTAAAAVVAVGLGRPLGVGAALVCLATSIYLRARRPIGGSGADQLGFIVLVVVGLVWAAGWTPTARYLGDVFLAAQVALAYFTAGVAKAVSATWRSGRAMTAILSTEGYGTRAFGDLLSGHPGLDRTICAAVIAWEMTFPLVFVLPTPGMVAYLAVGVAFHVGCALVMGLNRFVWSFCGCYPSVWAIAVGW